LGFLIVAGCAGEGRYSLQVFFPNDEVLGDTSRLIVWVLDAGEGSCEQFIQGEIDPEQARWRARLDIEDPRVDAPGPDSMPGVPNGDLLFVAEGRTTSGAKILRGCMPAQVRSGETVEVRVELVCVCEPVPGVCAPIEEVIDNEVDDDCDGKTDECESQLDCDDSNGCTQDLCVVDQCQHPHWPDKTLCDDKNPCTSNDACLDGLCTGQEKNCSDFDGACVQGECNPLSGSCEARVKEDLTPCEDGLFCSVDDICQSGVCIAGGDQNCDDDEPCTRDACSETERVCTHVWEPKPDMEGPVGDASCLDDEDNDCDHLVDTDDPDCLPCTVDEDCDDGNLCTLNSCTDNVCETSATNEGGACEDGLYCTVDDVCANGVCRGQPRVCVPSDDCHRSVCLEAADLCGEQQKDDGETCDDSLYCSVQDSCHAGVCQGEDRDCEDGDICTLDDCDEQLKECTHEYQEIPGAEGPEGSPSCGNGVDDDCDGQTDSADSDCCTQDCAGLECGPDHACGEPCGECENDETCWSGACMKGQWVTINSAGQSFTMGAPINEPEYRTDEVQHQVTFTRNFRLWSTQVTQGWYLAVMGYNPSTFASCGDDCPVEMVSWREAAAFCNALSEAENLATCYACTGSAPDFASCDLKAEFSSPYDCPGYRLPTEAEWEYAARAGTTESTYNGTLGPGQLECENPNAVADPIMWFCGNSGYETHEVMTKDPNDWGLYDMLGNVWDWCHDWYGEYSGDETDPQGASGEVWNRVRRGGHNGGPAHYCRAARRSSNRPWERFDFVGLRPARSVE